MTTLSELIAARNAGTVTAPVTIDNDVTFVYQGDVKVFEMHPADLLEALLTHVGIPFEYV